MNENGVIILSYIYSWYS